MRICLNMGLSQLQCQLFRLLNLALYLPPLRLQSGDLTGFVVPAAVQLFL